MSYSYPVYRLGMVFTAKGNVSVEDAKAIADQIVRHADDWEAVFRRAARSNNQTSGFRTNKKEKIKQRVKESYILNFPGMRFRMADFSVQSRVSVTVCMHGHQSKIWLMLTCSAFKGKPAVNLSRRTVEKYLSLAQTKARVIIERLRDAYLKYAEDSGVVVPRSAPYYFQLRAFNSLKPSSAELCEELDGELKLEDALVNPKYRSELRDFFSIAIGGEATPRRVTRAIREGKLDVFGYGSPDHSALFSIRTTDKEADLCGYGFDDGRRADNNLLAQASTRDLLNEYAKEF
ncbi:MAG: hypothetical protein AABO41_23560 [Acidobacteriota bacterium]